MIICFTRSRDWLAEIFTKNHGKITGIIFGGTSKKIKNYLQIGNRLYVNYNSKNENKLGYFNIEILKAYSPFFFDNPKKLLCIFFLFIFFEKKENLVWENFDENKIITYKENNELIFLDFTADWCVTCKFNKFTYLDNHEIINYFINI